MQVQNLEAQLEQSCVKEQLEALQRQLEMLEEEKKEVEGQLEEAEKKNRELEDTGEIILDFFQIPLFSIISVLTFAE